MTADTGPFRSMHLALAVTGWTLSGAGHNAADAAHAVDLPPPGTSRRGARLARLAEALSAPLLPAPVPERTAVLLGTDLGCLTETARVLEGLLQQPEGEANPRAFSGSVHNAIAGHVARRLGARGECHTLVQGEVSVVHALMIAGTIAAREPEVPMLVGAMDEVVSAPFTELTCPTTSEGGALLALSSRASGATVAAGQPEAIAAVEQVALARPTDPDAWWAAALAAVDADVVVDATLDACLPGHARAHTVLATDWLGEGESAHPSFLATALALSVPLVSEAGRGRRVAVAGNSRFGDLALAVLGPSP